MENQEIIVLESKSKSFKDTFKDFETYLITEFTHPTSGLLYEKEAVQFVDNLKEIVSAKRPYIDILAQDNREINLVFINVLDIICSNDSASKLLANEKIMNGIKEIMARPDFLNAEGEFNIKCIFSYMSESHNMDLKSAIPAKYRALLSLVGL